MDYKMLGIQLRSLTAENAEFAEKKERLEITTLSSMFLSAPAKSAIQVFCFGFRIRAIRVHSWISFSTVPIRS